MQTFDVRAEFQGGYDGKIQRVTHIYVHHAAALYAAAAGIDDVRSAANWHIHGNQWPGIGYHIALAEETNGGPIARYNLSDLTTQRAHVWGYNHDSIGVACLTNFGTAIPEGKWIDALALTLRDLLRQFPGATIVGHQERTHPGRGTACPGAAWPRWKGQLLDRLATPPARDESILGPASGSAAQALAWLNAHADQSYRGDSAATIVNAYQRIGDQVGLDWFAALAQCCHETGNLTSFWSLRPQRNPAGIGVTGRHRTDLGVPRTWDDERVVDGLRWSFNRQRGRWEDGLRFASWADHAVPAHLGRLLAYALRDDQATAAQRSLIATALAVRPLPAPLRGVAPTWSGLNGRWAVPGTTYGATVLRLRDRMRGGT